MIAPEGKVRRGLTFDRKTYFVEGLSDRRFAAEICNMASPLVTGLSAMMQILPMPVTNSNPGEVMSGLRGVCQQA